jgi:hypothetical protein
VAGTSVRCSPSTTWRLYNHLNQAWRHVDTQDKAGMTRHGKGFTAPRVCAQPEATIWTSPPDRPRAG